MLLQLNLAFRIVNEQEGAVKGRNIQSSFATRTSKIDGFQWIVDKTTGRQQYDDRFEWDDSKAAANWKNHRVTFDQAIKAFDDPSAFEEVDTREDQEERINLIGMCDGTILHVTYTERGERIRLISVRKAEKDEQDDYYRKNTT